MQRRSEIFFLLLLLQLVLCNGFRMAGGLFPRRLSLLALRNQKTVTLDQSIGEMPEHEYQRPVQQGDMSVRDFQSASVVSGESRQSRSLYVENLSLDVAWQDLKDHMRSLGGIVERVNVPVEQSGRSKGCGLVIFTTVQDTQNALNQLNNTELKGRSIFIREYREADNAALGALNTRLYVGQLNYRTEWQELKDHFKTIGKVTSAEVVMEKGSTRSKGYGIVEYASADDAAKAVETLNDSKLMGRTIHVRLLR